MTYNEASLILDTILSKYEELLSLAATRRLYVQADLPALKELYRPKAEHAARIAQEIDVLKVRLLKGFYSNDTR